MALEQDYHPHILLQLKRYPPTLTRGKASMHCSLLVPGHEAKEMLRLEPIAT
jgi:hypothetical protein